MFLPNKFKETIAQKFYDKTVNILNVTKTVGTDGGIIIQTGTVKTTFYGNVKFNAQQINDNEIGKTLDADIIITCPTNTQIVLNDTISYSNVNYIVNNILPSDSHLTITGKRCQ